MLALLTLLCAAPPAPVVPPAAVAPDYAYFAAVLADAEGAARDVVALGTAVARLHNAWATRRARAVPLCDDADAAALAARAPVFGAAYRDVLQSARARAGQLTRVATSPVVTPLVGPLDRERSDRVLAVVREHARAYAEASAWQAAQLRDWLARCKPVLSTAPGLAARAPRAAPEGEQAAAIAAVGGGRVCPIDTPADGRAVVVPGGVACYAPQRCDCSPVPVLPGAVIGP